MLRELVFVAKTQQERTEIGHSEIFEGLEWLLL